MDGASLLKEVALAELALSVEDLGQVLFSDEARAVDIEVVEGELQVLHGERLLLVDGGRQELAVVY
jgi:hypothetical protein